MYTKNGTIGFTSKIGSQRKIRMLANVLKAVCKPFEKLSSKKMKKKEEKQGKGSTH